MCVSDKLGNPIRTTRVACRRETRHLYSNCNTGHPVRQLTVGAVSHEILLLDNMLIMDRYVRLIMAKYVKYLEAERGIPGQWAEAQTGKLPKK